MALRISRGLGPLTLFVSIAPTSQSTTQGPAAGPGNVEAPVGRAKVRSVQVGLDYAGSVVLQIEFEFEFEFIP